MNILSIGGSDPSGGAGIQSDVRVFSGLNAYCFTVITGLTSQNTSGFSGLEEVSAKSVCKQLDSILTDFHIDAVKIGMVYSSSIIKVVSKKLQKLAVPIVVDPIITSTTKGVLLKSDSLEQYKKSIIPLASVITPNLHESEKISRIKVKKLEDLPKVAKKITGLGAKTVIITGIKQNEKIISDYVFGGTKDYFINGRRLGVENHGSGCNYSAALTFCLAKKNSIKESARFAKKFTYNSIKNSIKIGRGINITYYKKDVLFEELEKAITEFIGINDIYKQIPECQSNFVYAQKNPKTINDVLGVLGRIVKVGRGVQVAGTLEFGGSRHVATAIIEVAKKFPKIRSAVNIRYDGKTLNYFKRDGYKISSYDRVKEPQDVKKVENSSVSWGIKDSLRTAKTCPDVIFHRGDFGKEPMILVFAESPMSVISKLRAVF